MKAIGALTAYLLTKQLSKKWEDWDIFKLGLIDNKGKTLPKSKTPEEKKAMNIGTILAKNLKKILQKVPFGKSTIGSAVAALYLIKEHHNLTDCEQFDAEISKSLNIVEGEVSNARGGFYPLSSEYISEGVKNESFLPVGKYMDSDNNIFLVKEELSPIAIMYDLPLYELYEIINKDRKITSTIELTKIG